MPYTYNCTSCGATAQTTRAVDLRNRSGRRCQSCKDNQPVSGGGPRMRSARDLDDSTTARPRAGR